MSGQVKRLIALALGERGFVAVDPWGMVMVWSVHYYAQDVRTQIVRDICDDKPWSYYYNRGWRVRRCRVVLEPK